MKTFREDDIRAACAERMFAARFVDGLIVDIELERLLRERRAALAECDEASGERRALLGRKGIDGEWMALSARIEKLQKKLDRLSAETERLLKAGGP